MNRSMYFSFLHICDQNTQEKKNLQEEMSMLAQDSAEIIALWWERNTMEYTGNKDVHFIVDQKQWKRKTWL